MIIDDGLLPENFASEDIRKRLGSIADGQSWFTRYFGRRLIKFGIRLCRITRFDQSSNTGSSSTDTPKDPLWSRILYYYHLYFTIKLIMAIYHSYVFDYHKYKLDRFNQVADSYKSANLTSNDAFRKHLVDHYDEARSNFKSFGAPFLHHNFFAENMLIYLLLTCHGLYVQLQIYVIRKQTFDFSIFYTVIDLPRMQKSLDAFICDRVNHFIASSREHRAAIMSEILAVDRRSEVSGFNDDHGRGQTPTDSATKRVQAAQIIEDHQILVRQIKCLAMDGKLQPINRRDANLKELADWYSLLLIAASVGISTWGVFWFTDIPAHLYGTEFEADPMDLLFGVELYIFIVQAGGVGTFNLIMVLIICLDQASLVSHLITLIDTCISANTYILGEDLRDARANVARVAARSGDFLNDSNRPWVRWSPLRNHRLLTHSGRSDKYHGKLRERSHSIYHNSRLHALEDTQDELVLTKSYNPINKDVNVTLMHTLLHYKVFVKQYRSQVEAIDVYPILYLYLTTLLPVITRLLIAYLNSWQKIFSILMCIFTLVVCDIDAIAICWLHMRCVDLYRHLHSLLAHVVEMDQIARMQTGREAYDDHLIYVLRRELDNPERMINQFAIRSLTTHTKITYQSMVKHHFQLGFIIISILVLDPTQLHAADIFGSVWRFFSQADIEVGQFFYRYRANVTLGLSDTTK